MNIQKFFPYLLVALLAFTLQNCKKPEPISLFPDAPNELPPVTTEGKNTMGCYVDGKLWVVPQPIIHATSRCTYDPTSGYFYIYGRDEEKDEPMSMQICLSNYKSPVLDIGSYKLSYTYNQTPNDLLYEGWTQFVRHETTSFDSNCYNVDTVHTGMLHIIKIDKANRIIAGRFEYEAYNKYLDKTVKITDGRFDLRY